MIQAYKNDDNLNICEVSDWHESQWLNVVQPSREEIETLTRTFNIPLDFIEDPLDSEESGRTEYDSDSGHSLIIIDFPIVNDSKRKVMSFTTTPIGIILSKNQIITICSEKYDFLEYLKQQPLNLKFRSQFAIKLLLDIATQYNRNLRLLNKSRIRTERSLKRGITNKHLYDLMEIEKSLLYFFAALNTNSLVFKNLFKLPAIKRFEEDQELLEDLHVEHKQSLDTTELYISILESITSSYTSLLSNEMNTIMKTLTLFTVFLTLPTLVFSFFGMNVQLPISTDSPVSWLMIIGISLILICVTGIFLWRKNKI
ncbi:magnesium transporter CorA family protein [Staphylococcus massiliensis]|uniref:Magnesium transporter CorA n=1 Tax=Staphylococcus massiliensis S46 TaxID=1229783 RepID=K9AGC7_9STAP|nr:magnesium transporter CorA family protein [Staphylococcus massiliensis]EKU45176.1 hypothetical protein C273_11565 [Staphylococcus massiliensis S46]MCG3399313.1 magnesium transporter CorA family protein [Staphylococcus massiliensis]MCG3402386.1 magnesium transporter CorA family protein [Staphylococcus massiliensis]MCG3411650.1 magnesium transporter CorA family protein [Staphylococcus massiliensis]PNZ99356.1 magnesium transporter CorA family protein [Staphylococcus massiliensis CCUG 55927]